ncbi:MAG: gliding motility lipoprotein GldH [Sediminibacterium sp.]|jgi:gliding motility-associated lipoprotein GldH|nr:MAG: gliding motility lipoprotein GldH [Sediminibacterium sp.]
MGLLKNKIAFILLSIFFVFSGCETKQLFEQSTIYPNHNWPAKQATKYQFNVTDTAANYKIFFVIRHHNAYHYKNIWLDLTIKSPTNVITKQVLNLNLADDAKGWLGSGMDDIYDQRIPMTLAPIHLNKGMNEINIQHTMREDPLENILSTGIRVEKVKL